MAVYFSAQDIFSEKIGQWFNRLFEIYEIEHAFSFVPVKQYIEPLKHSFKLNFMKYLVEKNFSTHKILAEKIFGMIEVQIINVVKDFSKKFYHLKYESSQIFKGKKHLIIKSKDIIELRKKQAQKIDQELNKFKIFLAYSENSFHFKAKFETSKKIIENFCEREIKFNLFQSYNNSATAFKKLNDPFFHELVLNVQERYNHGDFLLEFYKYCFEMFFIHFESSKMFTKKKEESMKQLNIILEKSFGSEGFKMIKKIVIEVYKNTYFCKSFDFLKNLQTSRDQNQMDLFFLEDLFLFCCQFFFIWVLPNPFFFPGLSQEKSEITTKLEVLKQIEDKKRFFLKVLGNCFPEIKESYFLEMAYLKITKFTLQKLEQWENAVGQKEYDQTKAKFNKSWRNQDSKKGIKIDTCEIESRNISRNSQVFFINGFLSKEENNRNYFQECFNLFDESEKKLVYWDSASLKEIIYKSLLTIGVIGLSGLIEIPLFEIQLIFIPLLGLLPKSLVSIGTVGFKAYSNAEENSKDQGVQLFERIKRANKADSKMMDFIVFSLGSEFVFAFLKKVIETKAPLFVRNVVMMG